MERVSWRALAHMLSAASEERGEERTAMEGKRAGAFQFFYCIHVKRAEGKEEPNGSTALIILQSNSLLPILKTPLVSLSFHFLPATMYTALQWSFNR